MAVDRSSDMRVFLTCLAVAGVLTATAGVFFSTRVLILVGAAAVVIAVVMAALAIPRSRGER